MACNAPNFQLELMIDDPVVRESFQKLQQWLCDDANGLTAVIKDLISATSTPGFTWGNGGNQPPGKYLLNDNVPSNDVGRVIPLELGAIARISIAQKNATNAKFTVVEHDGSLSGAVDVTTVSMGGVKQKVFDFIGAGIPVTPGRQLGVRVDSVAAFSPDVGLTLIGEL